MQLLFTLLRYLRIADILRELLYRLQYTRQPNDRVAENVRVQGLARPRCLRASSASLAPLGPRMERERPRTGQLRQDPSWLASVQ